MFVVSDLDFWSIEMFQVMAFNGIPYVEQDKTMYLRWYPHLKMDKLISRKWRIQCSYTCIWYNQKTKKTFNRFKFFISGTSPCIKTRLSYLFLSELLYVQAVYQDGPDARKHNFKEREGIELINTGYWSNMSISIAYL